jgi:hypothetical protein
MTMMMKMMKIAVLLASFSASVVAFAPSSVSMFHQRSSTQDAGSLTRRFMFGGAGDGGNFDDDPAMDAQMEMAAKQLGIPLDEYKLGLQARMRLTKQLDEARITAGDESKIAIERDANNPPKYLEIIVTEEGKALGKDVVTKEVLAQLQSTAEYAKTKRGNAQRDMMMWIGEEMKKRGK